MMDIKDILLISFINFLVKRALMEQLSLCQIKHLQMNFINKLLKFIFETKVYSSFKDNVWGADYDIRN